MYKDGHGIEVDVLVDIGFGECHFHDGPYRQHIHLSLFLSEIAENDVELGVVLTGLVGKLDYHAFLAFSQEDRDDEVVRLEEVDVDLGVIGLEVLCNDALQCF